MAYNVHHGTDKNHAHRTVFKAFADHTPSLIKHTCLENEGNSTFTFNDFLCDFANHTSTSHIQDTQYSDDELSTVLPSAISLCTILEEIFIHSWDQYIETCLQQ